MAENNIRHAISSDDVREFPGITGYSDVQRYQLGMCGQANAHTLQI